MEGLDMAGGDISKGGDRYKDVSYVLSGDGKGGDVVYFRFVGHVRGDD